MTRYKDLDTDNLPEGVEVVSDLGQWLGKYDWYQIGTETISGVEVPIVESKNTGRYYYFNGQKIPYTSKNEIKKLVANYNATLASEKEAEAQETVDQLISDATEDIAEEQEYQKEKRDEAEAEQQKYSDYFASIWGEDGEPTIGSYTQKAIDAANAYAQQQAQQQAEAVAKQSAHASSNQAMQAAVNAGMSPAQAALMGGQSSTAYNDAYANTYQDTYNTQQNQYLDTQNNELALVQQQQSRADQNYDTATQNLYNQNTRQDNYVGVAQDERDYQNEKYQQELANEQQAFQNQLSIANAAIQGLTGVVTTGADLAEIAKTGAKAAATGA